MVLRQDTRFIHFHGILRRPVFEKPVKYAFLRITIVRKSAQTYFTVKPLIPRGFYGYVQCMYAGNILADLDADILYDNQIVYKQTNASEYLHSAISCSLEAVFTSIINLGLFLSSGFVIQRDNPIAAFRIESFIPDTFYVKLLGPEYQAQVDFFWEEIDTCNVPEADQPPPPTPPPLPPPLSPIPPVPPNSSETGSFPTSPAYDGQTDSGLTYKPPSPLPDELGNRCIRATVFFVFQTLQDGSIINPDWRDFEQNVTGFGEFSNLRKEESSSRIRIMLDSHGSVVTGCTEQVFSLELFAWDTAPGFQLGEFYITRIVEG